MKKLFLMVVLVSITGIVSAPSNDIILTMLKFREGSDFARGRFHELEFSRFIHDLGYRESGNNWQSINLIGCFGEWQFHESTLKFLGFKSVSLRRFRANPEIFPPEQQLAALKALIRVNLMLLEDYEHFIGDSIHGVKISRSGMIAASHLGGARSLQKFLDTGGRINKKDVLGTSILDYLKKFRDYELD